MAGARVAEMRIDAEVLKRELGLPESTDVVGLRVEDDRRGCAVLVMRIADPQLGKVEKMKDLPTVTAEYEVPPMRLRAAVFRGYVAVGGV